VNWYNGRRALVLGGLGFIGSNLAARLVSLGARTTVVTPAKSRHAEGVIAQELAGISVVEADLRDISSMSRVVAEQDVVFNLAGQSGAVRSMEDPWTDLDVNCRGNLVLLEAVRRNNPTVKVVFVGSRLQYGRPLRLPAREEDTGEPLCLHAIHKSTVEQYLQVYSQLFGLRYSVARVTNPYGPGQPADRTSYGVINRLIHLALADGVLTIYGDGSQLRDYVYVDDVSAALMMMGSADAADGRIYNVGSGQGTSLIDVARDVIRHAGAGRIRHVEWPPLAARIETGDFVANISRIERELGWRPSHSLERGLEQTIAFYRARVVS
jgi:UDP-glucose 4-epimerase